MKIKFLWSTNKVTGSKIYFEFNHKKILIDYGLEQEWKSKLDIYKNNSNLKVDPKEIDYIFLTHSHIDHSWLIPFLVKNWFNWKIITQYKNKDLLKFLWIDSCYIMNKDYEYLTNKKNIKNLKPFYTEKDITQTLSQIVEIDYKQPIYIDHNGDLIYKYNDIKKLPDSEKNNFFTFYNSWHIVWSAYITFSFKSENENKSKTICFSGDLWRSDAPLLIPFETISNIQSLIIETTYWNRKHTSFESELKTFSENLLTWLKKWKVIIPSFSLDRTQTLIYLLKELKNKGLLKNIPIYIDTPLWNNITKVYEKYLDSFKAPIVDKILNNKGYLFSFDWLKEIDSKDDSISLIKSKHPCIIIAASWMAENWRIVFHLEEELINPDTTILFVWFTTQGSLWYKIRNYKNLNINDVEINWKKFSIKSTICSVNFSSHWDQIDLLKFIDSNKSLKRIILNHWSDESKFAFKTLLNKKYSKIEVIIAKDNFYYII